LHIFRVLPSPPPWRHHGGRKKQGLDKLNNNDTKVKEAVAKRQEGQPRSLDAPVPFSWKEPSLTPLQQTTRAIAMRAQQPRRPKRRRPSAAAGGPAMDLQAKVTQSGGPLGHSLEEYDPQEEETSSLLDTARRHDASAGLYGSRTAASTTRTNATRTVGRPRRLQFSQGAASTTTTQSLPSTRSRFSRPSQKSSVARPAVHVVCAISENMARETCVASLDAGSPTSLQVSKQGNGQTYAETLAYLEVLRPHEVLLNEGRQSSQLARKVLELYEQPGSSVTMGKRTNGGRIHASGGDEEEAPSDSRTIVKFVSRACFDQTRGAEVLRRVARPETYDATVIEEYILLSSLHAVLHYTQHSLGANFTSGSVFLSVNSGGNNRMTIDRSTLLQLELLVNSKTGKTKHSLIGTIDKTKTVVGGRLLRTNLMMPPTRIDTINARLDLVEAFLSNEDFFYSVLEHLSRFPDVDKVLSNVALVPKAEQEGVAENPSANQRLASKGISALVCIKSTLSAVPALGSVLQQQLDSVSSSQEESPGGRPGRDDATIQTDRSSLLVGLGGGGGSTSTGKVLTNHLLKAIIFTLDQPELAEILRAVSDVFTPSTEFSRNANAMRHQECFALKADDTGMMSVLRKAYLGNVDDIYKKADEYAELYGFHVVVKYTATRGHFLAVPADVGKDLPQMFIQPTKSGKFIHCTTEEINSLNMRSKDNVHDLLVRTYEQIQTVLNYARERYDALAALCDAIALLDMCHSFADTVSLGNGSWCRPLVFDPESPDPHDQADEASHELRTSLVIRNGRFGIEVPVSGDGTGDQFVPNDTYAACDKRFTLITGINGSGKSTYLKQLAIIVVLAHCGSYVPAEQASIPLRDRLCTRIGNSDDQENNISTFMLEMKETAFICNSAGPKSLVLVDELGRATSNEDGVALAWSVAEYLLKKKAMTFFVTHFQQLTGLAGMYPSVQNIHLDAALSTEGREIKYTHRVQPGACRVPTDYGVALADSCGWPSEVVKEAQLLEMQARTKMKAEFSCESATEWRQNQERSQELLTGILDSLVGCIEVSNAGSFEALRIDLASMRNKALPSDDGKLSEAIGSLLLKKKVGSAQATVDGDDNDNSSISSESSEGSLSTSSSSKGRVD
jgi:DNA mismatch repair protein MSH4